MISQVYLDLIKNLHTNNLFKYFNPLNVVALIAGVGLSTLSYKTIRIYLLRRKYRHIPGPKTQGILGFYLGNVVEIAKLKDGKIFSDLLVDWIKEYGNVIKFQLLDDILLLTADPEGIRNICINHNFPKGKSYHDFGFPLNSRFLGNGLVTDLDNERWRWRRSLFNPSFHKQALISFIDEFNNKSDILMDKLRSLADGKTVITLLDEINNMTMDVIASVGFGMEIDSITKDNNLKTYVYDCLKSFNQIILNPSLKFTLSGQKSIRLFKDKLNHLRNLGRIQILNRIKLIQDGSYTQDDLLTIMLKQNLNEEFDIEDLVDDFVTFFVAGQDTTANLLSAVILEMGQRPHILKKIRDEIDREIGLKVDISYEDVNKLKYLNSVVKETLRLWGIVGSFSRYVNCPIKIGNFDIPIGSEIIISSYASGRLDEFFPNPTDFDPERFYSDKYEIKNYTYFPFSIGPRNCIGQNFAMIEVKLFLLKFFRNFNFELEPGQSLKPVQYSTISPESKTRCILTLNKTY